jgi:serine/threonine protein kinase
MQMTPDNWDRAKVLFEAALELDSSQRTSFLAENCREESLRKQVEELLTNYQEAGTFLDDPALNPKIPASKSPPKIQTEDASRLHPQSGELLATATSAEAEDPMVGRQLGAYKLVRRVGQGGMAAVFLAVRADDEYRKQVAIKLVPPGLDSGELLIRFRNERQTLAGLDHPNIVKLLDGGSTPERLPFLVMDYVEGSPIDEYCDQHKFSVDERLHLFGKVCDAVQYAHQKLVVHRDLKPSNILVVADGTPRLLDFGIAKVLNPEPSGQNLLVTQTGTRCMTPAYASPEQMRGKSVTPATDIYSLGVVLYELLTGHRPYRLTQHTPAEMERAICEQEPETPSTAISRVETDTSSDGRPVTKTPELVSETREGQPDKLRRRLRGDLDNIVLKALQKDPQRRYDSVQEFSEDIGRHLQHLPVKARRSTLTYRASKFMQRHSAPIVAALIGILLLSAGTLFTVKRFRRLADISSQQRLQVSGTALANPPGWLEIGGLTAKSAVPCENLASLRLPDTDISLAQSVPAGTFTLSGQELVQSLPAFCRVEGSIGASADSDIQFAVWMPVVGWNGKFRGVGNGGFAGTINFVDMGRALRRGYATASTDTGHRGGIMDSAWALGHPEKVADLGYRAVHEMTDRAKMIIRSFYGHAPKTSYFEGYSNGGREGLMEAERFPEDYQGILVGAPPISATRMLAMGLYITRVEPPAYIPASKLPAISAAVLAACDALDGVSDGILNDPRQCHFDPSVLRCHGVESDSCLTSPQVAQLKKIYAGFRNSKGEQLYPGYLPGGEEGDSGWETWITGDGPGQGYSSIFGLNYFRDMVFENPTWDFRTFSAAKAVEIADRKTSRLVDATDSDLHRFRASGGKLIVWHGWSDPAVPGTESTNYYESVVAKMGLGETQSFMRLYMVPGMHHSFLGPGANFFGQVELSSFGGRSDESTSLDPQHNVFTALEEWVEHGTAPDAIIATKYVNDLDHSQGLKMTRPLCPYPQFAKYKGTGDTNDATNFVCTQTDNQAGRAPFP